MPLPNLPEDLGSELAKIRELARAAFTAANSDKFLPGKISMYAGPAGNLPPGWLVCDGAAVSRNGFADLFAAIGTTWGPGDGSTTFNVPDLRGRVLVGDDGSGFLLGQTGGGATHSHTNPTTGSAGSHGHTQGSTGSAGSHTHTNPSTGSAGSHTHDIPEGSDSTASVGAGGIIVSHNTHDHDDTGSAGSHGHTQGSTGSAGSHGHTNPTTATEPAHSHTQGATGSGSSLPPYAVLTPIIRY